jgi:hypothetical protein
LLQSINTHSQPVAIPSSSLYHPLCITMSTEADKKALNVQRVQKSVAKKMAQMNDQEKHEYQLKKKEINRKGQANYAAKKARLAEDAFKAAVAEGAQVLFENMKEETVAAAVKERAQARSVCF